MKLSVSKIAAAQLIVDREKARTQKLAQRRVTRELVKSLRLLAEMIESGEIVEWGIERNFGMLHGGMRTLPFPRNDEMTLKFRYPFVEFAKRLRRRKAG